MAAVPVRQSTGESALGNPGLVTPVELSRDTDQVEIRISVPGPWDSRADLLTSVTAFNEDVGVVADYLVDLKTNQLFRLEARAFDSDLVTAFALGAAGSLSSSELEAIRGHSQSVYVTGAGGSFAAGRSMQRVGRALLRAGGIAVKVETSGRAHGAADWSLLCDEEAAESLYHTYVTLVGAANDDGTGRFYSCGMHNIGLRDAMVEGFISADEAAELLQCFLLFTAVEAPYVSDGDTFGPFPNSFSYKLYSVGCDHYAGESPFHNPYGMWRLTAVTTLSGD